MSRKGNPPSRRELARIEAAKTWQPRVYYSKAQGRFVTRSEELAVGIAHEHYQVVEAIRKVEHTIPVLASEFVWSSYINKAGREHPCASLSRNGIQAVFNHLRPISSCRDPRAVLDRILKLFDDREVERTRRQAPSQNAEPAPDTEIRPPDPEPADLFQFDRAEVDWDQVALAYIQLPILKKSA
jgi:hypothetical protein